MDREPDPQDPAVFSQALHCKKTVNNHDIQLLKTKTTKKTPEMKAALTLFTYLLRLNFLKLIPKLHRDGKKITR